MTIEAEDSQDMLFCRWVAVVIERAVMSPLDHIIWGPRGADDAGPLASAVVVCWALAWGLWLTGATLALPVDDALTWISGHLLNLGPNLGWALIVFFVSLRSLSLPLVLTYPFTGCCEKIFVKP